MSPEGLRTFPLLSFPQNTNRDTLSTFLLFGFSEQVRLDPKHTLMQADFLRHVAVHYSKLGGQDRWSTYNCMHKSALQI